MSDLNPTTISHETHLIVDLPEPEFIHQVFGNIEINPDKVYNGTACWEWQGRPAKNGYGRTSYRGKVELIHRVFYALTFGAIPRKAGKEIPQIDHLCRNRRCVIHLELVSRKENILRGDSLPANHARQTHCKRGHELKGANLYLSKQGRQCKTCFAMRARQGYHKPHRVQSRELRNKLDPNYRKELNEKQKQYRKRRLENPEYRDLVNQKQRERKLRLKGPDD